MRREKLASEEMMQGQGQSPEITKKYESRKEGYHDLVDCGRPEVYKIEG